ncbi:AfsR/SARP family transcriptional regulator [Nocardia brasiliensis]|uniref:AfsR/SARP family transcriptional regulator n=1 Tax=Nocardia brasiliensis TaxID=37326 RepID=UPI001895A1D5|nr:BTAD domain-containing putative transcriptional regulator [Nocardia brasiliensis]MBF6130709.1 tetratricopeptide repeat protein [Nocardia brasiliensis]
MRFAVLGPLEVHRDGEAAEVSGALRQGLLAMLLSRANRSVPADRLLTALWGAEGTDDGGPRRLQVLVHRLRSVLDDPDRLSFGPGGYRLHIRPGELDAETFCADLDRARELAQDDPAASAELIRRALRLWRGTPYHEVDLPDVVAESRGLSERRLVALEVLYDAELRCGRHAVVIAELSDLAELHPLRERVHWLLIAALYGAGRRAEALAAYRGARTTLASELGLDPGPELRALESAILAGEPIPQGTVAPARVTPSQLPCPGTHFIGRADEFACLDRLRDEGSESAPAIVLTGMAGVGKTALVVRWAHQVAAHFPDGQLFIDLRGYGPDEPVTPEYALVVFLRSLGVDGSVVPPDPAERAALFRTAVAHRRLLIILDNASSVDQVRPLLPGAADCFVLVTSRDRLPGLSSREGATRLDLPSLTTAESRQLLDRVLGAERPDEPEATAELIERCAGLPLALRIAAERVRAQPDRRIGDLLDDLTTEGALLDHLDTEHDPQASIRSVFGASYRRLEPAVARTFRMLGLHPGHDFDVYGAAALAGIADIRTARLHLRILVRASILDEIAGRRYRFHDLLWAYATELTEAAETPRERAAALTRLFDYYQRMAAAAADLIDPFDLGPDDKRTPLATPMPAMSGYSDALDWLQTEHANLIRAAVVAAERNVGTYATDLSTSLCGYLDIGWYLDCAWAVHTRAVASATQRGDSCAQATALRQLGLVKSRMGRPIAESVGDLEAALDLRAETDDPLARAADLATLGMLRGLEGRLDQATEDLRHAVDRYRACGRPALAYRPLIHLGFLLRQRGHLDAAAECLCAALSIAEDRDLAAGRAHALCGLSGIYRDARRFDDAIEHGHRAVTEARAIGLTFLEGFATNRLGTVYREFGDYEQALRQHKEAATIFRAAYNRNLEAMALNSAGAVHFAAESYREAIGAHTEALTRALPDSYQQAVAYEGLAAAFEGVDDHDSAARHRRHALRVEQAVRNSGTTMLRTQLEP